MIHELGRENVRNEIAYTQKMNRNYLVLGSREVSTFFPPSYMNVVQAIEMRFLKRMLCVPWTTRKTN